MARMLAVPTLEELMELDQAGLEHALVDLERLYRTVYSGLIDVLDVADQRRVWQQDGHRGVWNWLTALTDVSPAEAPTAPPPGGDPPTQERLDDIGYLERLRRRLLDTHPDVRQITMPHERPVSAIRDAAKGYDDAMFAVSTAHPGPFAELLEGSTAADIIRTARVPVLVVSKHGTSPP
jgi:nucleotide-binding universal stress UspA family protein